MISDQMYSSINGLVTHFEKLANEYRQMRLFLYAHPSICLKGFGRMLQNESKERWHTSEKVCMFMKRNGRPITLDASPKPKNDFTTIRQIFDYAVQLEEQTVNAITNLVTQSIQAKDYTSEKFLKDLLEYCIYEHQEVKEIQHIIIMTEEDKTAMMLENDKLYEEYDPHNYYKTHYDNCEEE